jgi:hydrogenase maturation protein HypF
LGFRPHVYRLAQTLRVTGYVANTDRGLVILAQGRHARRMLRRLEQHPPPLAAISSFVVARVRTRRYVSFTIKTSRLSSLASRLSPIHVLPDIATCADCLRELRDPKDRRHGYPFTNCTQCGPRYSIIRTLPYDRPRTTMADFPMCPRCRREYTNPADRRHHAQPIACPDCGPKLSLASRLSPPASRFSPPASRLPPLASRLSPLASRLSPLASRLSPLASRFSPLASRLSPIEAAARALLDGRIVAIKSLGGFQLACDATNDRAVARLRKRKNRPAKPLALMCEGVAVARRFCRAGANAGKVLLSSAAPIVLLPKSAAPVVRVADSVAPGNARLGVMLCYTPLHAVLFKRLRDLAGKPAVLVMTSANRKDDPITADDAELAGELADVPDLVLTHDRPIANRCDDSVVLVDDPRPSPLASRLSPLVTIRRARGYAPQPITLPDMFHVKHAVLAVGAEFKNAFALAQGNRAFLSPHIGTVATVRGERFWLDTFARYAAWTGIRPEVVACDLHPDYASTRLAERLSLDLGLPLIKVQHHHAHVLSVMAEHGLAGPTLGLAFDGTGYGTDGAVWGCEFLLVRQDLNWLRVGHLGYMRLSGAGDEVANPSRVAREYLRQANGEGWRASRLSPLASRLTSSLGRLFDAVAAMTGVCRTASFDGQAPTALEAVADPKEDGHWFRPALLDRSVSPALIRPEPILLDVARETSAGTSPATISARFHNTVALAAARLADALCRQHHVGTVCLSGGSFQNARLRRRLVAELRRFGRRVYWNRMVPLNDGGIALGQVAAAAAAADSGLASRLYLHSFPDLPSAELDFRFCRLKMPLGN